ncbi:MAG: hypothetical protein GY782_08910 [Gammaproteobacteria bacterium]|nr:hypothetical protein [Gammaproteobacteria bacterium]
MLLIASPKALRARYTRAGPWLRQCLLFFVAAIFAACSSFFTPYSFAAREFKPCFLSLFVFVFLGQAIFVDLFYPIFFVHRPCIKSKVAELSWELKSHFPSNRYAM